MKFLPLRIAGACKSLHRVRREKEDRTRSQAGLSAMRTWETQRIAINLCGGLGAYKTSGTRADRKLNPGLVTGHKAAAKTAGIRPHAGAARFGNENFYRRGRCGGSNGAFTGHNSHCQMRVAALNWRRLLVGHGHNRHWCLNRWCRRRGFAANYTVRCFFTMSSFRCEMGPSATTAPRSMI